MNRRLLMAVAVSIPVIAVALYEVSGTVSGGLQNALVASPTVLELGLQKTGTSIPIEFAIENQSLETIRLGDPVTDCGCLLVRVGNANLRPGDKTVLQGVQRITVAGNAERKIVVPYEAPNGSNHLFLSITFVGDRPPAIIQPSVLHLGKVQTLDEGAVEGQFRFLVQDREGEEVLVMDAALSADFRCQAFEATMKPDGEGEVGFAVRDWDDNKYGLLSSPFELTFSGDQEALVAEVTLNRVPGEVLASEWPDCRMIIPGSDPSRTYEIFFPGLDDPHIVEDASHCLVDCALEREPGRGHRLTVSAQAGGGSPKGRICEFVLRIVDGHREIRVLMVKVN